MASGFFCVFLCAGFIACGSAGKIHLSVLVSDDGRTITVEVKGEAEGSLPGATVTICDSNGNLVTDSGGNIASKPTGGDGKVVFDGIKSPGYGDYLQIVAKKEGLEPAGDRVEWKLSTTFQLKLHPPHTKLPTAAVDTLSPCLCDQCDPCSIVIWDNCCPTPVCVETCSPAESPCPCVGVFSDPTTSFGIAKLALSVPEDATVFINGRRTAKTGAHREYISPGLKHGLTYTYVVRAEVLRNGNVVAETHEVLLRADQSESIAFNDKADAQLAAGPDSPRSSLHRPSRVLVGNE